MALGIDSAWLRRYAIQGPPAARLVCLPHAGGSASFFHRWGHAFGAGVEVLATRYPGRQERIAEPLFTAMEPMADALTEELRPLAATGTPLALFGHSMGASLAYEVTLRLQERYGTPPALLMVSCRKAPHLLTPRAELADKNNVLPEVRRMGGTDAALLEDPDLRELILPAIEADFGIVARYGARPGIQLECPVVGYLGEGDPDVDEPGVRGWESLAPKGFEMRVLPGGHFYLVDQEAELVRDVGRRMAAL
ncbi:thioesterase II family protein [Streptomyces apocyni]|uniref:thioesterase II family protein n=1 Tax=Streptomyces apocyni TaxID=2654677 RepID=UPI0012EA133C|nr:alpha/beta fold hydrolase [Streptomyces apocyni]